MIVLVAGVAGSGKTTVGRLLARRLGWAFEDGDALHPPANIAKMRAGVPLTDADREPWLNTVAAWLDTWIEAGQQGVVACSALKRHYRDQLRDGRPQVRVVLLRADRDLLLRRLRARHGHFFRPGLLDSQLADLQLPQPGEPVLVVSATAPPALIVAEIIGRLHLPGDRERGGRPRPQ